MARRIDSRNFNSFPDANLWDESDDPLENVAVSEIVDLASVGEIHLIPPHSVITEIDHPNTPAVIKRLAVDTIRTLRTSLTPNERDLLTKLRQLIQGAANPGKHDADAMHLFEAYKYGGGYFITKDVRLLKKASEVESMLTSLRIVRPSEFMRYYRSGGL